jgi:membrane-bound serine protease (ClpP class)
MRMERRARQGRVRRPISTVGAALIAAVLALCSHLPAASASVAVHIRIAGVINPIAARYVRQALTVARDEHAAFLLMSLDTPGGLVSSMQEIVAAMENSAVPVVAFVEPRTAQASSAGAFLLLASDVAAMAPGTRVGAAHPVEEGKSLDHVLDEKVTNSLVSLARSLAAEHKRPETYAESIVRESKSLTSDEAKQAGAVELLASNVPDLLTKLDGYRITGGQRERVLVTKGLALREMPMSASSRLLDVIANPTLASILLTLGVLGILYELSSPGIGAAGIVGTICLVLALVALSTLPLALGGVVLCLAGIAAVAVEVKAPSHGALAAGGVAALILGASILVDERGYFGAVQRLDLRVFVPLVLLFAGSFLLFGRLVARAMKAPVQSGMEALKGACGSVKARVSPAGGMVFVEGSRWDAVSDEVVEEGQPVTVIEVMENPTRLRVKPAGKGAE